LQAKDVTMTQKKVLSAVRQQGHKSYPRVLAAVRELKDNVTTVVTDDGKHVVVPSFTARGTALRDVIAKWVSSEFEWSHKVDLTMRGHKVDLTQRGKQQPSQEGMVAALEVWWRWMEQAAGQPIYCFYVLERDATGRRHFHILLGGMEAVSCNRIISGWRKRYGWYSTAAPFDPARGAAWYNLKAYTAPSFEYDFKGKPSRRTPEGSHAIP
jgi:hypothetical protein